MLVKICGITNLEDALAAIDGGARALGFNFHPRSPRCLDPAAAARIIERLPGGVLKAGVFVNESPRRVEEVARIAGLDVAQLHGDETPDEYPAGITVWKAFRAGPDFSFEALEKTPVETVLLDGPAGALYGGGGHPFDWSRIPATGKRIVLAGGLDASNVREAIAAARPWGVDACSRLEAAPGVKDHAKLAAFLQAALT